MTPLYTFRPSRRRLFLFGNLPHVACCWGFTLSRGKLIIAEEKTCVDGKERRGKLDEREKMKQRGSYGRKGSARGENCRKEKRVTENVWKVTVERRKNQLWKERQRKVKDAKTSTGRKTESKKRCWKYKRGRGRS